MRNAFLDHRVRNVHSLVRQVATHPDVADRFERHFGLNRTKLIAYLRTLHRTKLQHPEKLTVYSVPRNGHIRSHKQTLRKGEIVFADRTGKPILMARCGNPLTRGPEVVTSRPSVEAASTALHDAVLKAADAPSVEAAGGQSESELLSAPQMPREMVYEPIAPETLSAPALAPPALPGTFTGVGAGEAPVPGLVPALGGVALAVAATSFHSAAPTPEPATFIVLGAGVLAVAWHGRKRSLAPSALR